MRGVQDQGIDLLDPLTPVLARRERVKPLSPRRISRFIQHSTELPAAAAPHALPSAAELRLTIPTMHRATLQLAVAICAAALLLPAASADDRRLGARIQAQPPRLSLLAGHVGQLGEAASWDFASITLDELQRAYREELDDAARERPSTPERRAKLARWQRATAALAAQIHAARLRLLDGARFSLYVDPQHQVLIIVDGQPVAVSGPRPAADRLIEERVIAQFCAYNDCRPLHAAAEAPPPRVDVAAGSWILGQNVPPTFEVYRVMRCEFEAIAERDRKAQACREAADEAVELATALQRAQRQGYRIDWNWLADRPPSPAAGDQLAVNSDGAYLELPGAMLARLAADDWRNLVSWLRGYQAENRRITVLRQAGRLLD